MLTSWRHGTSSLFRKLNNDSAQSPEKTWVFQIRYSGLSTTPTPTGSTGKRALFLSAVKNTTLREQLVLFSIFSTPGLCNFYLVGSLSLSINPLTVELTSKPFSINQSFQFEDFGTQSTSEGIPTQSGNRQGSGVMMINVFHL